MKILIEESVLRQALEALSAAGIFMRNGIALGYIRMPDDDCPDPAKETPSVVGAAITALRTALDAADKVEPVAWMCSDESLVRKGYSRFSRTCEGDWNTPVYTHPAPAVPEKVGPVAWIHRHKAYPTKVDDLAPGYYGSAWSHEPLYTHPSTD